jgi:signal transduction histidine kinase
MNNGLHHSVKSALHLLRHAVFSFRTLDEAEGLALLLADISMNPGRTATGYSELLINAVEHGNLGIGYAKKRRLIEDGCWKEEVNKYLQLSPYADRRVEVILNKGAETVVVTVADQGDGFAWGKYLEIDPARVDDIHGRGIAISKGLCFDELEYLGKGNIVVATVQLPI